MRQIAVMVLMLFWCGYCHAQVDKFKYQPDKIQVGTVYHYTKSGIDGSKPMTVSVYVDSKDGLQVFKTEPGYDDAALIIADMNWEFFSANGLRSMKIYKSDKRDLIATLAFEPQKKSYLAKLQDQEEETPIPFFPVHVYNFDFITLNFIFRHLKDPKQSFKIGVADPDFTNQKLFVYDGEATIEYVEDVDYKGTKCRKYKISGKGMQDKEGWIWVDYNGGYFVNVEIPVPDNPDWKDFKFELKKVDKMTPEQWSNYIATNIGRDPY